MAWCLILLFTISNTKADVKVGACGEMNGFIRQIQGVALANEITPQQALQLINAVETIEKASGY